MASRITNFEAESYSTTKLKIRATTEKVPEIIGDVTTISNKLTSITENLKKLVQEDVQSSDFIEETNSVITIANNINDAMTVTMKSLINDAYERICKVSDESKAFQSDLLAASTTIGGALNILNNLGKTKIGKISSAAIAETQSALNNTVLSGENQDANLAQDNELTSETTESSTPAANATTNDAQQGTSASNPEASETATTESAPTQETNATPAPEQTPDPAPASAGGSVAGALSPGTTANTFQAKAYNLSPEEYKTLCATVYAEASERPERVVSDTMGVTSVILNRTDSTGGSVVDTVSAGSGTKSQQFSGYGVDNGNAKFTAAMNDPNVIPVEMRAAIDRTLAGERNTDGKFFSGNGEYNSFR